MGMRIFLLTFRLHGASLSSIFTLSASHLGTLKKNIGYIFSVLEEKALAALSQKGAFIIPVGRAHNPVGKHSY